ncbi:MAG: hypothetical protein JEZ02_21125 [Desulfatibacillum sp.]|nr:hypothetical protein [Desulfatibacillum sp.]
MKIVHRILRHRGARVFLFLLAFLAITWPFMAHSLYPAVKTQYLHLFIAWVLVILLLFLISRSSFQNDDDSGG